MHGFLLLDKPEGISSANCVYKLRSKLSTKKIGHCGTLDPLATGLLPICIGEATKFSNYATNLDKVYEVGLELGIETDTGDITGKIISKSRFIGSDQDINHAIGKLEGNQNQMPPMYSAIKINGNPLYRWARKGVYLYREPRNISIKHIELTKVSGNIVTMRVSCTKGTYIRTLVETLGRSLGSLATMISLRRLEVGDMQLNQESVTIEDALGSLIKKILPCDVMCQDMDRVTLNPEDAKKIRNGLSIDYNAPLKNNRLVRIYTGSKIFIGIGEVSENFKLLPKRLLSTN